MALSPVRRRGFAALRAMVRWRPLAWVFGGMGTAAALAALPGGSLWRPLVLVAAGTGAAGAVAREDRRLRDAERLHRRSPQVADLDRAPAASPARMRHVRRRLFGEVIAGLSLLLGAIAFLWWISAGGLPAAGRPRWWLYLVVPAGLIGLAAELRRIVRMLRQFPDPAGLPRSRVTVLGFTGQGQLEVVVVPGVVPVAELLSPVPAPGDPRRGDPERKEPPPAFAALLGWRLGELIPGDVLVCDGELIEGGVVAFATDDRTDWTSGLRVLPWSQIWAPSFRGMIAEAWREGSEQVRDQAADPAGRHGRRAAVRHADGSLSIPGPRAGATPPWGEAR